MHPVENHYSYNMFPIGFAVPPKSVQMYYLPSKDAEPQEIPNGGQVVLKKGQETGIRCKVLFFLF